MIAVINPALNCLDCDTCRKYEINPETHKPKCFQRTTTPIPRDKNSLCDCEHPSKGCLIGNYDEQKRLTAKNRKAYSHYMECKAIGRFPHDGVVEQNAGIIYQAEQAAERLLTNARHHPQSHDSPRT